MTHSYESNADVLLVTLALGHKGSVRAHDLYRLKMCSSPIRAKARRLRARVLAEGNRLDSALESSGKLSRPMRVPQRAQSIAIRAPAPAPETFPESLRRADLEFPG
jgi:hypothetical protein